MSNQPTDWPEGRDVPFQLMGPSGKLECLAHNPSAGASQDIAVLCHPHPLFEGSMHNKIIHTLSRGYAMLGLSSLRFNFRGVGKSEGEFGDITGECQDAMAVIEWLKATKPDANIYLAGFSFGSYVASWCSQQIDCQHLLIIAPPVERMPFQQLTPTCPWLMLQGMADDVVDPHLSVTWFDSLVSLHELDKQLFEESGHFFHGDLLLLRDALVNHLESK